MQNLNLVQIDSMVDQFLQSHQQGIATLHRIFFKTNNHLSLLSLIEQLKNELRTGCVSFINSHSSTEEIDPYLFYIVNAFCKRIAIPASKKKLEYICPGCLFLDIITPITNSGKLCYCDACKKQAKNIQDPKQATLYKTFAIHNKHGYHCYDCNRFIPHPFEGSIAFCPYTDCSFVGAYVDLRKMNHPTSSINPEKLILDDCQTDRITLKDRISSIEPNALQSLENKQELEGKVKLLHDIIDSQSNSLVYSSTDFTVKHKQFVYQAFDKLLQQHPQEMSDYLLEGSRSGGFQHKIFQEYIYLLEKAMPFFIKKNRKQYRVDSLLNEHLCIFDGISVFNGIVTDKLQVKNQTAEFYIGGRKATYTQPYYIGKLLNIIDAKTKQSLLHLVKSYTFSRIYLSEVKRGSSVIVTHLRIPPHYQMGGMVYVNRVRKKIVDRAQSIIQKESQ